MEQFLKTLNRSRDWLEAARGVSSFLWIPVLRAGSFESEKSRYLHYLLFASWLFWIKVLGAFWLCYEALLEELRRTV